MRVLRLEDAEGRGVYRSLDVQVGYDQVKWIVGEVPNGALPPNRPAPGRDSTLLFNSHAHFDGGDEQPEQYFFGFRDRDQLLRWFSADDLKRFLSFGIKPKVFTVPKKYVIEGDHQLAFRKDKAKLVEVDNAVATAV